MIEIVLYMQSNLRVTLKGFILNMPASKLTSLLSEVLYLGFYLFSFRNLFFIFYNLVCKHYARLINRKVSKV